MKKLLFSVFVFGCLSTSGQNFDFLTKDGSVKSMPTTTGDTVKQNRLPWWKKWVIFGDSFSATGARYSARVDSLLNLTGTTTFGVSGHTFAQQSAKVDSIVAATPTYFTAFNIASILLGVNDFAGNAAIGLRSNAAGTASIAGYLKNMIEKIQTSNKNIEIYVMTPPEANGAGVTYHATNSAGWNLSNLATLLSQIAFDYGVQCIDLHAKVPFNLSTIATLTSDGLHPNYFGSIFMAGTISQAFISRNSSGIISDSTTYRNFTKWGVAAVSPTSTTNDIITIQNPTAAASGLQQGTGAMHWIGRGWGTTAGTSQTVDWWDWVLPVQGTTPTSERRWVSGINGTAATNAMVLSSAGNLTVVGGVQANNGATLLRQNIITTSADGAILTNLTAATVGVPVQISPRIRFSGQAWDGAASRTGDFIIENIPVNATSPITAYLKISSQINAGGYTEVLRIGNDAKITHPSTVTAGGTTGAQTINKPSGSVNFAAAATTLVVTNSLATTSSQVFVQVYGTDATATSARVTKAAGSFTITLNAAATAETAVGFFVIN